LPFRVATVVSAVRRHSEYQDALARFVLGDDQSFSFGGRFISSYLVSRPYPTAVVYTQETSGLLERPLKRNACAFFFLVGFVCPSALSCLASHGLVSSEESLSAAPPGRRLYRGASRPRGRHRFGLAEPSPGRPPTAEIWVPGSPPAGGETGDGNKGQSYLRKGYLGSLGCLTLGPSPPPVVASRGLNTRVAHLARNDREVNPFVQKVRDVGTTKVMRCESSDNGAHVPLLDDSVDQLRRNISIR